MLLEDERLLIKWLSQYQVLHREQIIRMLHGKEPRVAERIIRNVKRRRLAVDLPGGYLATDEMAARDDRVIQAVWVLLHFIRDIGPMDHYPATYPTQIFFLKGNTGYEIMILHEGEEHLTRLIEPQEDTKYIIVLDSVRTEWPQLLDIPHIFATIDDLDKSPVPVVHFYSKEVADT